MPFPEKYTLDIENSSTFLSLNLNIIFIYLKLYRIFEEVKRERERGRRGREK